MIVAESNLGYQVWRDVKLPAGKILIPGVVSHATDLVEHSELVADRTLRSLSRNEILTPPFLHIKTPWLSRISNPPLPSASLVWS